MKKIFLLATATACAGFAHSQQLMVKPNALLAIKPNTAFQFDALTLTPSAEVRLTAQTISNDTAVDNTLGTVYVPNTFVFSDTFTYSGAIRINYLQGQLNGITETDLQLGVYNGSAWQNAGTTTVNTTDNYVLTTGINALPVGELVLTTNIPLSMDWGDATAARDGFAVRINWVTFAERNVHHFDIYRSIDGLNWSMAVAGIPAMNKAQRTNYSRMDAPAYYGKLYYRIRQVDMDGRSSFSKAMTVAAVHTNASLVISPNPATTYFTIANASGISRVDLLNTTGSLVKSWTGSRTQYSFPGLAAGAYYVVVNRTNGDVSRHQLIVK